MNNEGQEMNIPYDEIEEAKTRMVTALWPVFENYRIVEGSLVGTDGKQDFGLADSPKVARYLPMARPELPGEFAKLVNQDESAILDFARRYGLLGYSPLKGDPVTWISAHAKTVKLLMDLIEGLQAGPASLKEVLDSLISIKHGKPQILYSYAYRVHLYPYQAWRPLGPNHKEIAQEIIKTVLSKNLEGMRCIIKIDAGGIKRGFHPGCLLDVIYWLVADSATQASIRRCLHCHRPFIATSGRMKYCPAPLGYRGELRPCE